jgi:adenosylcobinamide-GDP ribazoletransferase
VNALRLCLGTLTVLPVGAPRSVDRRTAGWAMVLAPAVGLLLGLVVVAFLLLVAGATSISSLGAAVGAVALLAALSRGLHLDGLADTADGLGSGRTGDGALTVMSRSDIGPFGVVTIVILILLQVVSVERLVQAGSPGLGLLVASVVVSRAALPLLCRTGVPAARSEGLGAAVAGSVTRPLLLTSLGLTAACVGVALMLNTAIGPIELRDLPGGDAPWRVPLEWRVSAAVVVPAVVTGLFVRRCLQRFAGITGDVLGAAVEITLTTALLVSAFA